MRKLWNPSIYADSQNSSMSAQCQINSRLTTSTPCSLTRITESLFKVKTQIRKYVVKDNFFADWRLGQLICKLNCCCGSFFHILQFVVPENFHPEQPFCKGLASHC